MITYILNLLPKYPAEQILAFLPFFIFIGFIVGFVIGKKLEENIWVKKGDRKYRTGNFAHGQMWYVITEQEYCEKILNANINVVKWLDGLKGEDDGI